MLIKKIVSVSTTPALLSNAPSVKSIAVSNTSSHTIYLGEDDVTTTTGMEIDAGETYGFELRVGQSLYAVCSTTVNVTVLDVQEAGITPSPAQIDLSSLTGATGAIVASTVAGLGGGTDGKLGLIRVGTYPDAEYVELVYDAASTHWVSKAFPLAFNSDFSYMGTNTTAYSYLSTNDAGGITGGIGVATKPVRHAAELFTAGLTLQGCLTAVMKGATAATFTVQAKFFQNSDTDVVVFSADGSTAIGECGAPLVSGTGATIHFYSTGWRNVVENGGSSPLNASDVIKTSLWPRLYGKVASGSSFGSVIDIDLQVRWVG